MMAFAWICPSVMEILPENDHARRTARSVRPGRCPLDAALSVFVREFANLESAALRKIRPKPLALGSNVGSAESSQDHRREGGLANGKVRIDGLPGTITDV